MREQAKIISSDRALATSSRNDRKIAEMVMLEFLIERFLGKKRLYASSFSFPPLAFFMPQEKKQQPLLVSKWFTF